MLGALWQLPRDRRVRAARATAARWLLVSCVSLLRLLGRMQARFKSLPGQQHTEKLEIDGARGTPSTPQYQNTQPYARILDVHDDVQVAPISLLVDLHRGVRDRFDFCPLRMLLQIKLLARRFDGGLEGIARMELDGYCSTSNVIARKGI